MNATPRKPARRRRTQASGKSQAATNDTPLDFDALPDGCILGLCYSGMHDTSIALVSRTGEPVFATSLERLSRVKQDGRWPTQLLKGLPWERIDKVALSVSQHVDERPPALSRTHPLPFVRARRLQMDHGPEFHLALASIPLAIEYVPHHLSHAASAFWGSGFEQSLCLVYDGGMSNEVVFGGLYAGQVGSGIETIDRFCCELHANVTHLYSAVTAALGFTPQKHEGKITGLAAYGKVDPACQTVLRQLLGDGQELDHLFNWSHIYSADTAPQLVANPARVAHLRRRLAAYSREDVAATVQDLAESHVTAILRRAADLGLGSKSICLSGGLFANVKVNQRVADLGFERFYVAPAMTDDGTALGAAWHVHAARAPGFRLPGPPAMYLGQRHRAEASLATLQRMGVRYTPVADPAQAVAERLAAGHIVALFQGAGEFGPRALCNRSILAPAGDKAINESLNLRLSRTEFMPFAPVVRAEDAATCFDLAPSVRSACEFMTVTVPCTLRMATESPAVVHVDGTARPQLVSLSSNPLAYDILTRYAAMTSRLALVNTSFNVHEEPIVDSVDDALRGFFEAGLDHLYIEGVGVVERGENTHVENRYLREKIAAQAVRIKALAVSQGTSATGPGATDLTTITGLALSPYLLDGFHPAESWGAWSRGRHARITVPVDRAGQAVVELHISLSINIFEGLLEHAPVVAITVDDVPIGFALFRPQGPKAHDLSFYIRSTQDTCVIQLDLSNIASPRWLDPLSGGDDRELGFALQRLAVITSITGDCLQSAPNERPTPLFWGA